MQFTHWFVSAPVRRTDLPDDPTFEGFPLFARGAAQGRNPWLMSDSQWAATEESSK